jgi:hypothetical protein
MFTQLICIQTGPVRSNSVVSEHFPTSPLYRSLHSSCQNAGRRNIRAARCDFGSPQASHRQATERESPLLSFKGVYEKLQRPQIAVFTTTCVGLSLHCNTLQRLVYVFRRNKSYARPSILATASSKSGCCTNVRACPAIVSFKMLRSLNSLSGVRLKTT